jgi:hypothetical protein
MNRHIPESRQEHPLSRGLGFVWAPPATPFLVALTRVCKTGMFFHMRTTLIIDDALFRRLKRIAAEQKRTLSEVTQETLRLGLERRTRQEPRTVRKLPSFSMGAALVDVADRNQLFDVLDRK